MIIIIIKGEDRRKYKNRDKRDVMELYKVKSNKLCASFLITFDSVILCIIKLKGFEFFRDHKSFHPRPIKYFDQLKHVFLPLNLDYF